MACNVKNRTIFCHDNLEILEGINSDCIDLIYLDPPFNTKRKLTSPIGSSAGGAGFDDIFRERELKEEWLDIIRHLNVEEWNPLYYFLMGVRDSSSSQNFAYLAYMAIRLLQCERILKPTGSIYLHCDQIMSHYIKLLMDTIFGEDNYRNEIIWKRTSAHNDSKQFGRITDSIFFYGGPINADAVRMPLDEEYVEKFYRHEDERGKYQLGDLTADGASDGESGKAWKKYNPTARGRHWSAPLTGDYAEWIERTLIPGYCAEESILARLDLLNDAGLIAFSKNGTPRLKRYLEPNLGQVPPNLWEDIPPVRRQSKERTGWPTQKPKALLDRIIQASSKKGDIVLDPFCGCATACVAAEDAGRKWIGIDKSSKAFDLVRQRLHNEIDRPQVDWVDGPKAPHMLTSPPMRTDLRTAGYGKKKYVYVVSHPLGGGEYKVGYADNVKTRLGAYKTAMPGREHKVEYSLLTAHYKEIEKYIHNTFPRRHEWVTGDLDEIVSAIKKWRPKAKKS